MNFADFEFCALLLWLLDRTAESPDETGADYAGYNDGPSYPRGLVIPSLSRNAERN